MFTSAPISLIIQCGQSLIHSPSPYPAASLPLHLLSPTLLGGFLPEAIGFLGVPKLNLASSLSSYLALLSPVLLDCFFSLFTSNFDVLRTLPAFSGGIRVS